MTFNIGRAYPQVIVAVIVYDFSSNHSAARSAVSNNNSRPFVRTPIPN
jgi:hypothetical protein